MAYPLRSETPQSDTFAVSPAAERFAACFEQRAGLEWILAPDGAVLETNRAAAERLDAGAEKIAGRTFWDALWWSCGPEAAPTVRERVELAGRGFPSRCEIALRTQAHGTAQFELCFTPIESDAGVVQMILVEARDVSVQKRMAEAAETQLAARKRAEQQRDDVVRSMEDEQRWLRTVIAHAPVGIVLLRGAHGERVIVNPFARPFLGEPPRCTEMVVRFDGTMCAPGGVPCPRRTKLALRALRGETIVGEEALLRRADGRDARLLLSASPILDAHGTIYGAVLLLKDISKLRPSVPPPALLQRSR